MDSLSSAVTRYLYLPALKWLTPQLATTFAAVFIAPRVAALNEVIRILA